jgi:DNA polymerase III gamma/tau subunit
VNLFALVGCKEQKGKKKLPRLSDVLRLREDVNGAYTWFVEKILECVAGKRDWKKVRGQGMLSPNVSVSDEAYAVFLLENNWEFWKAMHDSPDQKEFMKNTSMAPLYTRGDTHCTVKFQGVPVAGLKRFNELYDEVKEDRKKPNAFEFENNYRLKKQEEMEKEKMEKDGKKESKKETKEKLEEIVVPKHDLDEDSENEDDGMTILHERSYENSSGSETMSEHSKKKEIEQDQHGHTCKEKATQLCLETCSERG